MLLVKLPLLPQILFAVTPIEPVQEPVLIVTFAVPCPACITQPDGTVHVYEVAPAIGLTEYVTTDNLQAVALPFIAVAFAGLSPMVSVFAALDPQELLATTEMVLELLQDDVLAPEKLTVIALVPCPAVITAPDGTVHV